MAKRKKRKNSDPESDRGLVAVTLVCGVLVLGLWGVVISNDFLTQTSSISSSDIRTNLIKSSPVCNTPQPGQSYLAGVVLDVKTPDGGVEEITVGNMPASYFDLIFAVGITRVGGGEEDTLIVVANNDKTKRKFLSDLNPDEYSSDFMGYRFKISRFIYSENPADALPNVLF